MENSHQADKPIGIIVMVLSAVCGIGVGLLSVVGGALLGMLGGSAAAGSGASAPESVAMVGTAAAFGGLAAVIGIVLIVCGLGGIAAGYGVMKSMKWGFTACLVLSALNILLNLASMPSGLIMVAAYGALAYFCWGRLNGKIGPTPMS